MGAERQAPEVVWPAASTIGVVLTRWGLVVPRQRRRRVEGNATAVLEAAGPNAA